MTVTFKAYAEMDSRVQSVVVGGAPLDLGKIYSIAACERDGDPADMLCRMKNVAEAQNTPYTLHTTLREYLKSNSPVTPAPSGNAIALDAPKELLTQVFGVKYDFR